MVDEAQDMKPLFYRLICRLVSMARSPPTLMLVGDPNRRSIAGTLRTRAS
jgi:superfamily I DNA/RNA helicase